MSDDMIRALAKNGGVIQINFGSSFLTQKAMDWYDTMGDRRTAYLEENGLSEHSPEKYQFDKDYRLEYPFPFATLDELPASFPSVANAHRLRANPSTYSVC